MAPLKTASQEEIQKRRVGYEKLFLQLFSANLPPQTVGINLETVTDVSSRDYPGNYPGEDHAWDEVSSFFKTPNYFIAIKLTNSLIYCCTCNNSYIRTLLK